MNQPGKTILIVEDDRALLKVLEEKLKAEGFLVVVALNGQDGLDVAFKVNPDLILLDIIMPVMDGKAMLNSLREDEWGKNVPVILLTNLNDAKDVADVLAKGVREYIVKADWSLEDLVQKIKEKLELKPE